MGENIVDLNNFYRTLPEPLGAQEQEILFYEYSRSKREEIREKLIEHNLRLALDYSLNYCVKHSCEDLMDDIFSNSTIALSKAVDDFDLSRGSSFSNLAYKYMDSYSLQLYSRSLNDAINFVDDGPSYDKQGDDWEDSLFRVLTDEGESRIQEDYWSDSFVEDIDKFLSKHFSDEDLQIIRHCWGINMENNYSQRQVVSMFNIPRSKVVYVMGKASKLVKEFINRKYPEHSKGEEFSHLEKKKFKNGKDIKEYAFNSYYGLGLPKKTLKELEFELSIDRNTITKYIYSIRMSLSEEEREKLPELDRSIGHVKYGSDVLDEMFNCYFGLNGEQVHEMKEIMKRFNISHSKTVEECLMRERSRRIKEGSISLEEYEVMKNNRKQALSQKSEAEFLARYEYLYNSFHGLNGLPRKSILELSVELRMAQATVGDRISRYEDLLQKNNEGM